MGNFSPNIATTREGRKEGKKEGKKGETPVEDPKPPLAAGTGGPVQEPPGCGSRRPRRADVVVVSELELPRAPWRPALLRKDADAVYPEDRSASAAMDALNVDHHLFGRMPER
jgi:hypothetical protein